MQTFVTAKDALLGHMERLGFNRQQEARTTVFTDDVVTSSAIEGIVEMTLDATQRANQPLTAERLFNWHAALFPTGRSGMLPITVGDWRTAASGPMQIVSGPIGRERVHFEAPPAEVLADEMQRFLLWFNGDDGLTPALKAGIAHLWFVTLHPFEDGNGRIARAISDMALARADGAPNHFYSLSSQLKTERQDYYQQLEFQQRHSPDITPWLTWLLGCLGRAVTNAEQTLEQVLFKAKWWEAVNAHPINERQRRVINRLLEPGFVGHLNTSKYAKFAKCSTDTALRDIQDLKARGILLQNAQGGRSTSYRLAQDIRSISDAT